MMGDTTTRIFCRFTSRYARVLLALGLAAAMAVEGRVCRVGAVSAESPQAAGDLDTTFGIGGKQTTAFFGGGDGAFCLAVQADGKIIAVGSADLISAPFGADFALARYNPDGSLDQSFGVGGKLTTAFVGNSTTALSVAVQADGKIVAAGSAFPFNSTSTSEFALARYNPDGSLDQGFGSGGKQTTGFFGAFDGAQSIALQADGKIVAAGYAQKGNGASFGSFDFALARYNNDGSLDQSFGSGGKQTTDFFGNGDQANAVAVQNGKIIAGGVAEHADAASTGDFALARYNSDGTLDPTFGIGGKQTTDFFGDFDAVTSLAVQQGGKIVVAGRAQNGSGFSSVRFALARYDVDGSLDQSFGVGGKQTTDFFGTAGFARAVATQADGKIVAAGNASSDGGATSDFALVRYNVDGSLDQTFGPGGKQTTDFFGESDVATAIAIQTDGKIVLAGLAVRGGANPTLEFALARYTADPDFSITFDSGSVTARAGRKVLATVHINRIGGFTGKVTVTPPAPSMGIKPRPPGSISTTDDTATFKLKVGGGVSAGSYVRTFTAMDDSGRRRTANLTIVVQ